MKKNKVYDLSLFFFWGGGFLDELATLVTIALGMASHFME